MPSTLKALIGLSRFSTLNFLEKFWLMNSPPAPQSMRVLTFCLLEPISIRIKIEFFEILAIVTECYVRVRMGPNFENESGASRDLASAYVLCLRTFIVPNLRRDEGKSLGKKE